MPKQAVELNLGFHWPRLQAQAEATLSLPSPIILPFSLLASWSSLAISSGVCCRGDAAVTGEVPLEQFVGLTLLEASHSGRSLVSAS